MGGGDAHKTPEGRLFVGGHWRDEQEWPLARTSPTPYYLHANGVLSPDKPGDDPPITLSVRSAESRADAWRECLVGRHADVPGRGGPALPCRISGSAPTRKPLSARNDVLVFQTPPLDRDIEVTGRFMVKLWASSDALDTDFTAKLIDVYPPSADFPAGVDLNVGDSIVRARYRNGPRQGRSC